MLASRLLAATAVCGASLLASPRPAERSAIGIVLRAEVRDSTDRTPIAGAILHVIGTSLQARSDSTGRVRLEGQVDPGSRQVRFMYIGYAPRQFPVLVERSDSFDLGIVYLAQRLMQIDDMIVTQPNPYLCTRVRIPPAPKAGTARPEPAGRDSVGAYWCQPKQ